MLCNLGILFVFKPNIVLWVRSEHVVGADAELNYDYSSTPTLDNEFTVLSIIFAAARYQHISSHDQQQASSIASSSEGQW